MTTLRLGRPEDQSQLLELFGAVPMEGDLVLATERGPDFWALYRMQRATSELWVTEQTGRLDAMGGVLVRDAWLEGAPSRVGYLGDLRLRFSAQRARGLARFYGPVLAETSARLQVPVFLTAVMASNRSALQALVRRKAARLHQPRYTLVRPFRAVSVHFTHRRKPKAGPCSVRTATEADLLALRALLDADHRQRPWGYRFDQGELEHRLAHWPGMSLSRTYLAHDASGRLVGCTSAWDPSAVKRYRVLAYRRRMAWLYRGYNLFAAARRAPRLPSPGQAFRSFYLCNTSIVGEAPGVFRQLLERIYADHREAGYHFFSFELGDADPLEPAVHGFFTRSLDFHLYAVTPAEAPECAWPEGRTGFEMALA